MLSPLDWNTIAMSLFWQETVSQFLPSIITLPSFCFSNPAIILKIVDLPHPDGPNSTKNSPFSTEKETFFKTVTLVSYDLFMSINSNFFILFNVLYMRRSVFFIACTIFLLRRRRLIILFILRRFVRIKVCWF